MDPTLIGLLWVVTIITWMGWLALCFKSHAPARREVLTVALILLLVSTWSTLIIHR
jgi:hypothetical protein